MPGFFKFTERSKNVFFSSLDTSSKTIDFLYKICYNTAMFFEKYFNWVNY